MQNILIVDDEILVIRAVMRVLDNGLYHFYHTTEPAQACRLLRDAPMDVIISDQRMPEMTGLELLKKAKEVSPGTIRILMSGYSDISIVIAAVNEGQIFQYVSKPWDNDKLCDIIASAVKLKSDTDEMEKLTSDLLKDRQKWSESVNSLNVELVKTKDSTINALLKTLKAKDYDLYLHSERVAQTSMSLASAVNVTEAGKEALWHAGMFHDIGKISIRDRILYKNSSLDIEEFNEMKVHPTVGADILRELEFLSNIADIVEQHHERLDGTGYPRGLLAGDILMEARILSVADSYDALTTDRVYRERLSPEAAIAILRAEGNSHYDNKIIEALAALKLQEAEV